MISKLQSTDVDEAVLRSAVRKCLDEERMGPIQGLGLGDCGAYVGNKLHGFVHRKAGRHRHPRLLAPGVPCVAPHLSHVHLFGASHVDSVAVSEQAVCLQYYFALFRAADVVTL